MLFQRDRELGLGRQSREFGVKRYSTAVLPAWLTAISRYREAAAILGEDPETRITPCGFVAYDQIESGFNENGPFLASLVGLDRIENSVGLAPGAKGPRRNGDRRRDRPSLRQAEFEGAQFPVVGRHIGFTFRPAVPRDT
jgi:hypothetical protein